MSTQHYPICMAEEYWADSYFSVARYYGGIQMNQYSYKIVNKEGITIFELSDPENEHYVGDELLRSFRKQLYQRIPWS